MADTCNHLNVFIYADYVLAADFEPNRDGRICESGSTDQKHRHTQRHRYLHHRRQQHDQNLPIKALAARDLFAVFRDGYDRCPVLQQLPVGAASELSVEVGPVSVEELVE